MQHVHREIPGRQGSLEEVAERMTSSHVEAVDIGSRPAACILTGIPNGRLVAVTGAHIVIIDLAG